MIKIIIYREASRDIWCAVHVSTCWKRCYGFREKCKRVRMTFTQRARWYKPSFKGQLKVFTNWRCSPVDDVYLLEIQGFNWRCSPIEGVHLLVMFTYWRFGILKSTKFYLIRTITLFNKLVSYHKIGESQQYFNDKKMKYHLIQYDSIKP